MHLNNLWVLLNQDHFDLIGFLCLPLKPFIPSKQSLWNLSLVLIRRLLCLALWKFFVQTKQDLPSLISNLFLLTQFLIDIEQIIPPKKKQNLISILLFKKKSYKDKNWLYTAKILYVLDKFFISSQDRDEDLRAKKGSFSLSIFWSWPRWLSISENISLFFFKEKINFPKWILILHT